MMRRSTFAERKAMWEDWPVTFPYAIHDLNDLHKVPREYRMVDEESVPPRYLLWHCPDCAAALSDYMQARPGLENDLSQNLF